MKLLLENFSVRCSAFDVYDILNTSKTERTAVGLSHINNEEAKIYESIL